MDIMRSRLAASAIQLGGVTKANRATCRGSTSSGLRSVIGPGPAGSFGCAAGVGGWAAGGRCAAGSACSADGERGTFTTAPQLGHLPFLPPCSSGTLRILLHDLHRNLIIRQTSISPRISHMATFAVVCAQLTRTGRDWKPGANTRDPLPPVPRRSLARSGPADLRHVRHVVRQTCQSE